MFPRARFTLYEGIREFSVIEKENMLIAADLFTFYGKTWPKLGAGRKPDYLNQGLGRSLVDTFLAEAKELGLPRVFALTYSPGFFKKCGFRLFDKEDLPQKVWKECVNCPQFPNCGESALIIDLE